MRTENLTDDRREMSIHYIVQQGVSAPAERFANLKEIVRICNVKTAFYGIQDCIFLGILVSAVFWFLFFQVDTGLIGCGVFLLSPLVYIAVYSFAAWKERIFDLYAMKMVCKYNLQLLSSFRMLYFSVLSLALNSMAIWMLGPAGAGGTGFLNLLGISFSATFLYGIAILFSRWRMKTVISQLVCPGAWFVLNVLFILLGGKVFEKFLMELPGYVISGTVVVSCMVYLVMLVRNTGKRIEGEKEYAFN